MKNDSEMRSQIVAITPEIAQRWLLKNSFNRTPNKRFVAYYADMMKRGQWKLNGEPIIFSKNNELLDGQHRLLAIVQANTTVEMLVVFNVHKEYFATIDTGKTRDLRDVFCIQEVKNYSQVSSIILKYASLSKGMRIPTDLTASVGSASPKKHEIKFSSSDAITIYLRDPEFWQNIVRFSQNCYAKIKALSTSHIGGLISFLHFELNYPLEIIFDFFIQLSEGGKSIKNNTIAILRDKLIYNMTNHHKFDSTYRDIIIAKTWNSYVSGKELKSFVIKNKNEIPELLIYDKRYKLF